MVFAQIPGSFPRLETDDPRYAKAGYSSSMDVDARGRVRRRVRCVEAPA